MSSVGQVVGGIAGFFLGGPYGAQIGLMLGGLLDQPKGQVVEGPRLEDLTVQTSTYGSVIPRVYGTVALNGNVIWLENNAIRETVTTKKSGGKGGAHKTTTRTYSYSATFAVGLCEGEMTAVRRIRIAGQLFYDAGSNDPDTIIASNEASDLFTFYPGSETQDPDPRMQADLGVANTPAYRGLCYIVFYDLPLADYGNSLAGAQVRVEVMQRGAVYDYPYTQASMPTSRGWRRSAWNGVIHVATGYISLGYYATSPDGVTWTDRYIGAEVYLMDVAWGNDKFVMVGTGSNAYTSTDGINWTARAYASSGWHTAVGWSGSHFLITTSSKPFERSADGVTWTSEAAPQGNGAYYLAVWNGSLWITVSGFGTNQIWTSPTGLAGSWTSRQTLSGAAWDCGASLNGLTVLASSGTGDTYTSPDGITWTLHPTAQPYGGVNQVVAGQDEFLFLQNHRYLITRDGVNFTNVTAMPVTGVQWNCGVWNGANFVAIAQSRTEVVLIHRLFVSPQNRTLDDIVEAECLRSGILDAGDIDTTALTQEVRGYRISSVGSIRSAIEPLQGAWPFDVIPDGYQIRFEPRGTSSVATIPADDLDCQPEGSPPGIQIKTSREMDTQLPKRVTINYIDVDREYDTGAQYAERLNTPAINAVVLDLPIVLTATEAAGKAEVLLYLYWLERQDVGLTLPPIYNHLQPGDVITVETDEGDISLRITAISYTSDQRLEVSARYASAAIYTPAAVGVASSSNGATTIVRAGASVYHLLDLPRVSSAQDGPVLLAAMTGALAGWRGGVLYQSVDAGTTWLERQEFGPPGATFGAATNALGVVEDRMIDASSVLTVALTQGELYDTTLLAMLAGANHFAYGAADRWEIIAAQKCTLVSGSTYQLQDLLRGRFGTEWTMGLHAGGDAVILLDSADIEAIPMDTAQIGASLLYRAITSGRDFSTDGNRSFTYQGVNLKPLSPILLNGSIDPGSGDWTLLWTRRSRKDTEWRDYVDAPLGEDSEQYQLDIYDSGSYSVVKRTITATAQTASYSAADQTTDFGSGQSTLYIKLYQVSATIGRGYPLTTSITR